MCSTYETGMLYRKCFSKVKILSRVFTKSFKTIAGVPDFQRIHLHSTHSPQSFQATSPGLLRFPFFPSRRGLPVLPPETSPELEKG